MKKNLIVFAGLLFLSVFLPTGTALGATVYVPDDYPTIQAAVDAASSGDTIIVRDGTYVENVGVNKSLTIESENGAETTIVQAANPDDHVFQVDVAYVTIRGFTAKGATGFGPKVGIYIGEEAHHCTLSDNDVTNNCWGVYLNGSSSNILTNNTANSNSYYGIAFERSSDNILRGNTMSNNKYNFGFCSYYSQITQTYSFYNKFSILIRKVERSYRYNYRHGDVSYFVHDIDTSNLVNGRPMYYLVNEKDKEINAESGAGYVALINSTNMVLKDIVIENNDEGILLVNTTDSWIENVTLSNNLNGIELWHSSDNTLAGNTANSNIRNGICLHSSSNNTLIDNDASSNGENGFLLDNSSSNILTENIANSNGGRGIYSAISPDNTLADNIARWNTDGDGVYGDGVCLYSSPGSILTDNSVSDNDYGIDINSSDTTLRGNDIVSNYSDNILLLGSNNMISNNNIENSTDWDGIFLNGSNNTIKNNNIDSNNGCGIWLSSGAEDNKIYLNNFNNSTNVWCHGRCESTTIWNSPELISYMYNDTTYTSYLGNYWSDYQAGDVNGDGIGDDPYEIEEGVNYCYPLIDPYEFYFSCDGDVDGDVDGSDLAFFADAYVLGSPKADLNNDGSVDADDVAVFAAEFGRAKYPILEFMEDFEDGVPDNWVDDGSGVWSVENGVYKMIGNSPAEDMVRFSYYDDNFSDFIYQVVVKRTQGNLNSFHGMYFRGDGTLQNRYAFVIKSNGYYLVGKVVNGTPVELIPLTYSGAIKQGYNMGNTLKVICCGSTISFYINDMFVNCICDSEFSSGKVGVQDADVSDTNNITHFDNVELFTLPDGL